eukprot:1157813-Pelagomonas_calceolata.AAC.3
MDTLVVFLKPRPQSTRTPKTPAAVAAAVASMPARCVLDGRQLMDAGSCYCCLRDAQLVAWLPTFLAG